MQYSMKSLMNFYKHTSTCGKVLIFVSLLLILIAIFNSVKMPRKEGYEQNDAFLFKKGTTIYDEFYAEIYDSLMYNTLKNDYEVGQIVNNTNANSQSIILDIGCGTGNHLAKFSESDMNVTGLDISPAMIAKAEERYPQLNFKIGDAMVENTFNPNLFTHILCLYFTIYYFEDKQKFFYNCIDWLMPGGHLIIHLVNKDKFDPILPPGNPLYVVSPQKYAKERITKTKIKFDRFDYSSNFDLNSDTSIARFHEKFQFDDGKVRKHEHKLYMEDETEILNRARDAGFILKGQIDLLACGYEHQYLYILMKP